MPNRTPEERTLIDSLDIIKPDQYCNGRTPTGYCRNVSGFRTDHLGTGRCYLHGGRAGRPVSHGAYSKVYRSELKQKYDEMINDPALIDMYGEMAVLKTTLMAFLESAHDEMSTSGGDFFVQTVESKFGSKLEKSPRIAVLLDIAEAMSRMYQKIVDAEMKSAAALTPKGVMDIVNQIKMVMDKRCGECPVRAAVGQDLQTIKVKQ
jgi:hypothetical protein